MNSRNARIIKEARGLFWPWCVVTIAAALPWLFGQNAFTAVGLLAGIPLLASLSLGNEFRHRTLSLLLSQPIDRMKIWNEKLSVTIIAAVSPVLVFWSGFRFGIEPWPLLHEYRVVAAGSWFIITVGSATFWTLFSRSTMGGLALNVIQSGFIVVAGLVLTSHLSSTESIVALAIYAFATLCYAGLMLWLGRRKLAQFQVKGGIAGDDLLMAGPNVMPQALAGLFRCRPDGASLNLIRKEFRLLRPLWLLTLLFVLCGTCLRITSWFIPDTSETRFDFLDSVVLCLMLTVVTVFPVLAGSLSLGEERTSGMQSWHMTQPVSVRRQWLIKLVMAMFAGLVCAVVVLLIVPAPDQLLPGPSFFLPVGPEMPFLLIISLLTFHTFWCACAVNGTVRAALWLFPVVGAFSLASRFGNSLGELAAAGALMDLIVSRFHPFPFTNALLRIANGPAAVVWLVVPTLLLAVIQSYRLFRTEPQNSIRSVLRYLLPLVIVAFLSAFSLRVFVDLVERSSLQAPIILRETHQAVKNLRLDITKLAAAHLQQPLADFSSVTVQELAHRFLHRSNQFDSIPIREIQP